MLMSSLFNLSSTIVDGTQSIVWRINAQTMLNDADREAKIKAIKAEHDAQARSRSGHRSGLASLSGGSDGRNAPQTKQDWDQHVGRRGLKMSYGSVHDIESFPCEDGDKDKVAHASVCIDGAHGQWIWNGEWKDRCLA